MLRLYNSLTRQVEDFKPIHDQQVGLYACGPTVYMFQHIGNFRSFATADLLVRTLQYNGYVVKFIMNITDVGHLTSDADTGEDKLEKSAKKEGKTAWEVAKFYTQQFLEDYEKLGLLKPEIFAQATDHIQEQIALILKLEQKGYTYKTSDGIYFDTSKFKDYGELSTLDQIKEGARVEVNLEKKNPRDFALWKFSYLNGMTHDEVLKQVQHDNKHAQGDLLERDMEWESPWGVGFPGWHIECSAMSMKYLGQHFDIHTGGVDHLSIHHPDEIAQSEAATGEKFVNYWVHTAFMLVQGQKMSKSLGNIYRLYDLDKEMQGFEPLSLRYLYFQTHYRQEMNFTFPALASAQNALNHLRNEVILLPESESRQASAYYHAKFLAALNNDLNMPEALAIVYEMLKSDLAPQIKTATIIDFDLVLGLGLQAWMDTHRQMNKTQLPDAVKELVEVREQLRKEKKFDQADQLRNQIKKMGYEVVDGKNGMEIRKIKINAG